MMKWFWTWTNKRLLMHPCALGCLILLSLFYYSTIWPQKLKVRIVHGLKKVKSFDFPNWTGKLHVCWGSCQFSAEHYREVKTITLIISLRSSDLLGSLGFWRSCKCELDIYHPSKHQWSPNTHNHCPAASNCNSLPHEDKGKPQPERSEGQHNVTDSEAHITHYVF